MHNLETKTFPMDKFKRILFMMAIPALVILFTACNDDEGATPDPAADLYGEWVSSEILVSFSIDGQGLLTYLVDELDLSQEEAEEFVDAILVELSQGFSGMLEFRTDNTYTANFGDGPETGTWTISEDKSLITLTQTGDSDPDEIDVVSLNATTLVVGFEETFEEDLDDDGTADIIDLGIELTFVKQ